MKYTRNLVGIDHRRNCLLFKVSPGDEINYYQLDKNSRLSPSPNGKYFYIYTGKEGLAHITMLRKDATLFEVIQILNNQYDLKDKKPIYISMNGPLNVDEKGNPQLVY